MKYRALLFSVLVLGAALRLTYFIRGAEDPFFRHPVLDAAYYSAWAESLAAGGLRPTPGFWGGPLYPYFLAIIFRLGGGAAGARIVQHLMGVALCWMIYRTGKRISAPGTALLAAFLYAVCAPALFYEGWMLGETLAAFLTGALLLTLLRPADTGRAAYGLAAGALSSLLLLVRPSLVPLGAFAWLAARRAGGKKAALIAFLAGFAVVGAAGGGLYHRYTGQFILFSPHGGINFWLGNGPGATGSVWSPPFARPSPAFQVEDFRREASRRTERELSLRESSAFWFRETAAEIAARPARFFSLFARKLFLFFSGNDLSDIYHWSRLRQRLPLLTIPVDWRLISPLALLGIIAAWNRRRRLALIYIFTGAYAASIALFFVTSRHRFPIVAVLCLAAAEGIGTVIEQARERNWVGTAALIVMGAALFAVFAPRRTSPPDYAFYFSAGEVHYRDGDYRGARDFLRKAEQEMSDAPPHPSIGGGLHLALGRTSLGLGETEEAERRFELFQATRHYPAPEIHFELAGAWAEHEFLQKAEESYLRCLELDEDFYPAWNNLGVIYRRQDRIEEAADAFRRALRINPEHFPARANLERLEGRENR